MFSLCPPLRVGGYPLPRSRWGGGTPFSGPGGGYPPRRSGRGTPPGKGYPPPGSSIACTCYAAGGMPFAFTQEDFLVHNFFCSVTSL